MGPVCNIMHEVGSLEAAMFSSDDRDCLMDDPNCPCSLLPLLFGSLLNLVELSLWTRATLQEHVLSPPSLIYIRLPAIDLWQSFTSHTRTLDSSPLILLSPSAPDLVTSQKYQSSLVYEGKNDLVCCDDISPYICAFLSVVSSHKIAGHS